MLASIVRDLCVVRSLIALQSQFKCRRFPGLENCLHDIRLQSENDENAILIKFVKSCLPSAHSVSISFDKEDYEGQPFSRCWSTHSISKVQILLSDGGFFFFFSVWAKITTIYYPNLTHSFANRMNYCFIMFPLASFNRLTRDREERKERERDLRMGRPMSWDRSVSNLFAKNRLHIVSPIIRG